jgi:transcription elongation factor GreA
MAKYVMTQAGFDKLGNELSEFKNKKRPVVIARIKAARELGDLSENADYQDAREEQAFIEGRIQELEAMIKSAEVVAGNKKGNVTLGSKVDVEAAGMKMSFTIVSPNESSPSTGFISHESPIGSALIGKKVGDKVAIKTPSGLLTYEITKIA